MRRGGVTERSIWVCGVSYRVTPRAAMKGTASCGSRVDAGLEVEVASGRPPGRTDLRDDLPGRHGLTDRDVDASVDDVAVAGVDAVAVVEQHEVAVAAVGAARDDGSAGRGEDGCAASSADVGSDVERSAAAAGARRRTRAVPVGAGSARGTPPQALGDDLATGQAGDRSSRRHHRRVLRRHRRQPAGRGCLFCGLRPSRGLAGQTLALQQGSLPRRPSGTRLASTRPACPGGRRAGPRRRASLACGSAPGRLRHLGGRLGRVGAGRPSAAIRA